MNLHVSLAIVVEREIIYLASDLAILSLVMDHAYRESSEKRQKYNNDIQTYFWLRGCDDPLFGASEILRRELQDREIEESVL